MRAPRRGPLVETFWKFHKWVWRISQGRLLNRLVGLPVLELTTTGRKSGQQRSVLLSYLDVPNGYAVIASNSGSDSPPAWWLNLEADPAATVTIGGRLESVTARRTEGDERRELWERATAANPGYLDYEQYTERAIPVVALERTGR